MNIKVFLSISLLWLSANLSAKNLVWYNGHGNVAYTVSDKHSPVVDIALGMFSSDMKAVTGQKAVKKAGANIEIYQLDQLDDKEFAKVDKMKIPFHQFITKQDAFYMGIRNGHVIIVGSNGRGTAYGILELSRQAGVSPWIWWGDVAPARKQQLEMDVRYETMQSPSVEYRGIFINDEDWTNRVWTAKKLDRNQPKGTMGPHYYRKVFELLLRLRANTIWPAMHTGTRAFFSVKGNKETADSCDIFVGTSHCEPMLRNNVAEWDKKKLGDYNYVSNRKQVDKYWEDRVRETAGMDAVYTLGMRGIHDGKMEGVKNMTDQVKTLQQVINNQRHILSTLVNKDMKKVPQIFVPYKEVLDVYEHGLKVPDDVMLMWCDDNYGYMTRLSNEDEQKRRGGAGVYYHLSYWGRPHDWLWLNTIQPGLVYHEMRTAYEHNARRMWIANVHDPKVAAYNLSLFLDMAWNINAVNREPLQNHLKNWLIQQFGQEIGNELTPVMTQFYHLTGIRRPEFMGWSQTELDKQKYPRGLSPVQNTEFNADEFGNELEYYLNGYDDIRLRVEQIGKKVRPELQDAYFAAITYPVCAATDMATKQLQAQEARYIGRAQTFHNDAEALEPAVRSMRAYMDLQSLTNYYNTKMAGGKWEGNMDMAPRNLPVFDAPTLPGQLTIDEIAKYAYYGNQPATVDAGDCIVRNAYSWSGATKGARLVQMLGHSMNAVSLPKGGALKYNFSTGRDSDSAVVRIAVIPTQPLNRGDISFSVSIDGEPATVFSIKEPFRSEGWKQNVLRGQAVRELPVYIRKGDHTLEIRALDEHILIDQWMLDWENDRQFYVFPIQ